MYGIKDCQLNEIRNEEYDSYKEALTEFADYWRYIAFDDWFNKFDFDSYKEAQGIPDSKKFTFEEQENIVISDLKGMTDREIFDYFEFKVVFLGKKHPNTMKFKLDTNYKIMYNKYINNNN